MADPIVDTKMDIGNPNQGMTTYVNPRLSDSTINVTSDQANKFLGGTATLANSGYVPVTPSASTPVPVSASAQAPSGVLAGTKMQVDPRSGTQYWYGQGGGLIDAQGNPMTMDRSTGTVTPQTSSQVNTLTSGPANADANLTLTDLQNRETDLASQQRTLLQNQLNEQIQGINADYGQRETEAKATANEENATKAAEEYKLGRTGTPYASDEVTKLNTLHQQQLDNLSAQRQGLIQKAYDAYNSGNISLVKEMLAQDKTMYDEQQKIRADNLQANSKSIADQISGVNLEGATAKLAQSQLDNFVKSGIDPSTIPADQKAQLEQNLGLTPGAFDGLFKANQSAANAKTATEQVTAAKDILGLLNQIPDGRKITIGGVEYTGLKTDKTGNRIFQETNNQGAVTYVTVDQDGNIVNSASGGTIGKASKGRSGTPGPSGYSLTNPKNLKDATAKMDAQLASRVGEEGKVSKEDWSKALAWWRSKGGTTKQFVAAFSNHANNAPGYNYEGMPIKSFKPAKPGS